MRLLLALALIITGAAFAWNAPAVDAATKAKRAETKRIAKPSTRKQRPRYYRYSREAVECERARHADPAGVYGGFPCWAQEALSPKGGNDRN